MIGFADIRAFKVTIIPFDLNSGKLDRTIAPFFPDPTIDSNIRAIILLL
jgi:hypothetical protein